MDCCGIIVVRENFFQNCYGRDSLPPLRTIRFQLILIVVDSVIQSIPLICSNLKLISSKIKSKYKNKNSSSHLMASAPTNVRQTWAKTEGSTCLSEAKRMWATEMIFYRGKA